MIDFTSWYSILNHFKLQQFNIISFFSLSKVTLMSSTYIDYLKYRYKSNTFSKIRLILTNFWKSGHLFFLHQRCPPISVYSSRISCGTYVSISVTHVSNRLRFNTFFTFILSFEDGISNEWSSLPLKSRHILKKFSKILKWL